ncbi:MAG: thioesterase, partial [Ruthenibacterium sp.]
MKCLREFLTEGSYTKELEMTFPRCDLHRRAKLSTLLSFVADVAGRDYDARELPYDRLLAMRQVFLLSRITLHITRLPQMEALLSVTTREDGIHAAHLMRNFVMEDAQGVCVSARSAWILVDPVTRKILRPESFQGKVV